MARSRKGRPLNGWIVLDKPVGLTSTQAVGRVRRLTGAAKVGHGGTLDPLATGLLPIGLGEATKTIAHVMDGLKTYRFDLRFGVATATDDAEGAVTETSAVLPDDRAIHDAIPHFVGDITQLPPQFSAIKIDGERAYDLARAGETVVLEPRMVHVADMRLTGRVAADRVSLEVISGKGCYMRALGRDLARHLGSCGHILDLRRLSVGAFSLTDAVTLEQLEAADPADRELMIRPVASALADIPAVRLTEAEAARLRQGQPVAFLRRSDRQRLEQVWADLDEADQVALATADGRPVALVRLDGAELRSVRVLNL